MAATARLRGTERFLGQCSPHRAGDNGENRNTMRLEFLRQDFSKPDQTGLADYISGQVRNRQPARIADHVDDTALATRHHARRDGVATEKRPAQIDLDTAPPLERIVLPQRPGRPGDAGVVDQKAYGAECPLDCLSHFVARRVDRSHRQQTPGRARRPIGSAPRSPPVDRWSERQLRRVRLPLPAAAQWLDPVRARRLSPGRPVQQG